MLVDLPVTDFGSTNSLLISSNSDVAAGRKAKLKAFPVSE